MVPASCPALRGGRRATRPRVGGRTTSLRSPSLTSTIVFGFMSLDCDLSVPRLEILWDSPSFVTSTDEDGPRLLAGSAVTCHVTCRLGRPPPAGACAFDAVAG